MAKATCIFFAPFFNFEKSRAADLIWTSQEKSVLDIQNLEINEQLAMINQLDEDEKNALIKIINSMLTKKRMKDLLDGKIKLAK